MNHNYFSIAVIGISVLSMTTIVCAAGWFWCYLGRTAGEAELADAYTTIAELSEDNASYDRCLERAYAPRSLAVEMMPVCGCHSDESTLFDGMMPVQLSDSERAIVRASRQQEAPAKARKVVI